jgi:hypothetical protein
VQNEDAVGFLIKKEKGSKQLDMHMRDANPDEGIASFD